jgi:hypothetical protein
MFMGEFYRAAERTTVWLGDEAEYTALAFEDMLEREATYEKQNLQETLGGVLRKEKTLLEKMKLIEKLIDTSELLLSKENILLKELTISKKELIIILEKENKFLQEFQSNTVMASQGLGELELRRKQLEQRCEELERQSQELERQREEPEQQYEELQQQYTKLKAKLLQIVTEVQRLEQVAAVWGPISREIGEERNGGGSKHVRASLIGNSGLMDLSHRLQMETPMSFLWQKYSIPASNYVDPASKNWVSTPDVPSIVVTPVENFGQGVIEKSISEEATPSKAMLEAEIDNEIVEIAMTSWWRRSWVIQEIAKSRRIIFQCGSALASWKGIYSVVEGTSFAFLDRTFLQVFDVLRMFPKAESIVERGKAREHRMELLDLLQRFRYCIATDPRDKVYSLLGLSSDVEQGDIGIDYMLPPQEVYKNIVFFFLARHKTLDILGAVMHQDSDLGNFLPSWVPDWSYQTDDDHERPFQHKLVIRGQVAKFYCAGGETTVPKDTILGTDRLILKGFVFDTLVDLCEPATDLGVSLGFDSSTQHQTVIRAWAKKALDIRGGSDPYFHTCGRKEAFWRTLIADAIGSERVTEEDQAADTFNIWSGRAEAPKEEIPAMEAFLSAVVRASNNRMLCITSNGYIVLASAQAEEGDLICILLGGQTPFILRKGDRQHYLIGACYVHGIMDGEAMKELYEGKYEIQDFVIS